MKRLNDDSTGDLMVNKKNNLRETALKRLGADSTTSEVLVSKKPKLDSVEEDVMLHETDTAEIILPVKVTESDKDVLETIREKCLHSNKNLETELEETKLKYYCCYFKKAIKHLPLGDMALGDLEIENSREGFLKAYSIAKTVVSCEVQMKSWLAVNAIFNVANNIVAKVIHSNFVIPYFSGIVDEEAMSQAFANYQTCIENDKPTELQCVAYLVQNEIQKQQPLQIPNPMFHSFTNQVQAVSKYITHLLKAIAQQHFHNKAE